MKNTTSSFGIAGRKKKTLEKTRDHDLPYHSKNSSSEMLFELESLIEIRPSKEQKPMWPL